MGKDKDDRKSPDGAPNDDGLFRDAVRGTRRLERNYVEPPAKRLPAKARFSRRDEAEVLAESLASPSDEIEGDSGDTLGFHRDGVGGRTFRKLRRGKFSVQDEIDLHGLTVADARESLRLFLESALGREHTCVRVVHGKGRGSGHGGPILKRKVDVWLRQWDVVLAFCSAQPADGGTGAVYVLLKRLGESVY